MALDHVHLASHCVEELDAGTFSILVVVRSYVHAYHLRTFSAILCLTVYSAQGKMMKLYIVIVSLSILLLPMSALTADTSVPKDVLAKIKAKAQSDSPGNRSAQEAQVNAEVEAYRKIQTYENQQVPVTVIDKIRVNIGRTHPYDYTTQLFFMNQQVNSYLKMGLMSSHLFPASLVKCEKLKWRLTKAGRPAVYRGTVKPGTVDVIYVEVRNSRGLIGQNFGFPNPGGSWEIMVWGDYNIRRNHREKFLCEKY